jgi:hypothetical protein
VEFWVSEKLAKAAPGAITSAAFAEYLRCYRNPETIHASCEDYRAAASIDLAHDEADKDRRIECPSSRSGANTRRCIGCMTSPRRGASARRMG